jgi:hypothetical protein
VECLRTGGVPLPGIFADWCAGLLLRLIRGSLWSGHRDDRLQPHALGLAGMGIELAGPGCAVQ